MFLLDKYDPFRIFLIIVGIFPVAIFSISRSIAPSGKGPEKLTSYESGIEPMGKARIQFQIRYYMFALVFVIFDVETVFSYPWAMSFYRFSISSFFEVLIFIVILVVGLVYAWRKGALEWS
uniref:NAD(P)H-quinone oxidoreductase subunit 3, chloroplastic n=1 Tax=Haplomitrium blumei TaxID=258993 RepID=A0A4Y5P7N9_9MARC|nr:NADH-plastoquinone oxidoreductase subunit 3 [Haplomitrium blumei]QCW59339.1 NADH-plastoquinone oxidoreductase subunit 3 [Haplomitrium blumei]